MGGSLLPLKPRPGLWAPQRPITSSHPLPLYRHCFELEFTGSFFLAETLGSQGPIDKKDMPPYVRHNSLHTE